MKIEGKKCSITRQQDLFCPVYHLPYVPVSTHSCVLHSLKNVYYIKNLQCGDINLSPAHLARKKYPRSQYCVTSMLEGRQKRSTSKKVLASDRDSEGSNLSDDPCGERWGQGWGVETWVTESQPCKIPGKELAGRENSKFRGLQKGLHWHVHGNERLMSGLQRKQRRLWRTRGCEGAGGLDKETELT